MICDQCQEDKSNKDFYKSTVCYRCTFRNKTSGLNKQNQTKCCKFCNNPIDEKRILHWKVAYCSDICAEKGKNLHNKNNWLRTINAPKIQRGFQYGKQKSL